MKIDVNPHDSIRIHADGAIMTASITGVIDLIRAAQGLPLVRPVSSRKTCPNPDCAGGWAPDLLNTGKWLCPVCEEEFGR